MSVTWQLKQYDKQKLINCLNYFCNLCYKLNKSSLSFMMYSSQLNAWVPLSWYSSVMLMGQMTHFCRRFPMKSCRPMRAKTLRQKTVRIITSDSFFTDWIKAPTIVFRPLRYRICTHIHTQTHTHKKAQTVACVFKSQKCIKGVSRHDVRNSHF